MIKFKYNFRRARKKNDEIFQLTVNVLAFSEYMNFIAVNHNIDIVDIVSIFMNQSLLLRLSNS